MNKIHHTCAGLLSEAQHEINRMYWHKHIAGIMGIVNLHVDCRCPGLVVLSSCSIELHPKMSYQSIAYPFARPQRCAYQ